MYYTRHEICTATVQLVESGRGNRVSLIHIDLVCGNEKMEFDGHFVGATALDFSSNR